jgi:hypothetical protein
VRDLQAATIHDGDDEKLRRRYAVTVRWRVVQRRKNVVAGIDGVGVAAAIERMWRVNHEI